MSTINLGLGNPHTGTVEDQVRYFETKFDGLADKAYKEVNSKTEPSFFFLVSHACQYQPALSIEASFRKS